MLEARRESTLREAQVSRERQHVWVLAQLSAVSGSGWVDRLSAHCLRPGDPTIDGQIVLETSRLVTLYQERLGTSPLAEKERLADLKLECSSIFWKIQRWLLPACRQFKLMGFTGGVCDVL